MNNNFLPQDYFQKGKGKEKKIKPWQSEIGSELVQNKSRCWDGLFGCEEFFNKEFFKYHARICNKCSLAITINYGVQHSKIDLLLVLLWQDLSLCRSSKELGATKEKLEVIEKMKQKYTSQLLEKIAATNNAGEQKRINGNFRKWFYESVGIEMNTKKDHVKDFHLVGAHV